MNARFITGHVEGVQQITAKLDGLTKSLRNRGMRKGMNAFTKPVLKAAKANLTKGHGYRYGHLRKSLGRKTKTKGEDTVGLIFPRKGFKVQVGTVKRGPRAGQAIYEDPRNIAHLVEYGHGGPRKAPAYPFMRPALDTRKDEGTKAMGEAIAEFCEGQLK